MSTQSAIHVGSRYRKYRTVDKLKNTDDTETKHNQEKQTTQNTAKHIHHLLQHSARKRGGLILQRSQAHTGDT